MDGCRDLQIDAKKPKIDTHSFQAQMDFDNGTSHSATFWFIGNSREGRGYVVFLTGIARQKHHNYPLTTAILRAPTFLRNE
jgi:hypothetical protein